jgi:hypothetical protein
LALGLSEDLLAREQADVHDERRPGHLRIAHDLSQPLQPVLHVGVPRPAPARPELTQLSSAGPCSAARTRVADPFWIDLR